MRQNTPQFAAGYFIISFAEKIKKPWKTMAFFIYMISSPGSVLLSHTVTHAVPLAMRGLTAVFGMGTGVSLSL